MAQVKWLSLPLSVLLLVILIVKLVITTFWVPRSSACSNMAVNLRYERKWRHFDISAGREKTLKKTSKKACRFCARRRRAFTTKNGPFPFLLPKTVTWTWRTNSPSWTISTFVTENSDMGVNRWFRLRSRLVLPAGAVGRLHYRYSSECSCSCQSFGVRRQPVASAIDYLHGTDQIFGSAIGCAPRSWPNNRRLRCPAPPRNLLATQRNRRLSSRTRPAASRPRLAALYRSGDHQLTPERASPLIPSLPYQKHWAL